MVASEICQEFEEPSLIKVEGLGLFEILRAMHDYARSNAEDRANLSQTGYKPVYSEVADDQIREAIRAANRENRANPLVRNLGDFVLNVPLRGVYDGVLDVTSYDNANGKDAGFNAIHRLCVQKRQEQAALDAEYNAMLAESKYDGLLNISRLRLGQRADLLTRLQNYAAANVVQRIESGDADAYDLIYDPYDDRLVWFVKVDAAKAALVHHRANDDLLSSMGNILMGDLGLTRRSQYLNFRMFDKRFGGGTEAVRQIVRTMFHPESDEWLNHQARQDLASARLTRGGAVSADIFAPVNPGDFPVFLEDIAPAENNDAALPLALENRDTNTQPDDDMAYSSSYSTDRMGKWQRMVAFMRADSKTKRAIIGDWLETSGF